MKRLLLFLLCLPTLLTAMEGSHVSPIKKQRIDQTDQKLNNPRSLASLATQALGGISQIKDQETRNAYYQATIDLLCNSNLPKDQAVHMLYQLPKEVVSENKELLEDWFNAVFKHDEKSKKDLDQAIKVIGDPQKKKEYKGGYDDDLVPVIDPNGAFIVNERGGIAPIDDLENIQTLNEDIGDTNPATGFDAQGDYFLLTEPSICLFKRDGKKWIEQFTYDEEEPNPPIHNLYDRKESEKKHSLSLDMGKIWVRCAGFSPCSNYLYLINDTNQQIMVFDIKGNFLFVDYGSHSPNLSWSKSGSYFAYVNAKNLVVIVEMDHEKKVVHKKYELPEALCSRLSYKTGYTVSLPTEDKVVSVTSFLPESRFAFSPDESYIAVGCEDGTIKSYALNKLNNGPIAVINNGSGGIYKLVFSPDGSFLIVQAEDTVTIHPSLPLTGREEIKTVHPTLLGGLLALNKANKDMAEANLANCVIHTTGIKSNRTLFDVNKDNYLAITFPDFVKIFSLNDNLEEPVAQLKFPNARKICFKENYLFIDAYDELRGAVLLPFNKSNIRSVTSWMSLKESDGGNIILPHISKDGRYVVTHQEHDVNNPTDPYLLSILWDYGISEQSFYDDLDVQQRALIIELVNLQQAGKTWPEEWEFPQNAFDHLPEAAKDRLKDVVGKPTEEADIDAPPIKNGKEEE